MTALDELAGILGLDASDPRVARDVDRAGTLVAGAIFGTITATVDDLTPDVIPANILQGIVVEVAAGLTQRSDRLTGSSQFADPTAGGARGPRDPLVTVRPQLGPFVKSPGLS